MVWIVLSVVYVFVFLVLALSMVFAKLLDGWDNLTRRAAASIFLRALCWPYLFLRGAVLGIFVFTLLEIARDIDR